MFRKVTLVAVMLTIAGSCFSEPIRTYFTKENKLPDLYELEVGAEFDYAQYEVGDEMFITPYARFALFDNMTIIGRIPYADIEPEVGTDESGLGDASLGFELVIYEDIFHYPYILPHVDVTFDTGDEEEGLGLGETYVTVGVTVGTTVEEVFHFSLDGAYELHDEIEDITTVAVALAWDLNDEFALTTEMQWTDEEFGPDKDEPITYLGGMAYAPTENVSFIVHGGVINETENEELIAGKVAISF